jgi:hypothetical protein
METRKCGPLDEVGDEVSEALVVGDDLPQRVDVGGHRHGREHPPLPPRHHVHVALDAARRRGRSGLRRRARASSVVVLVVGAPVVPCGGRGRGGDGAPGRGPRERGRRGSGRRARELARARDTREEGGGGRGESFHRSRARAGECTWPLGVVPCLARKEEEEEARAARGRSLSLSPRTAGVPAEWDLQHCPTCRWHGFGRRRRAIVSAGSVRGEWGMCGAKTRWHRSHSWRVGTGPPFRYFYGLMNLLWGRHISGGAVPASLCGERAAGRRGPSCASGTC